MPLRADLEDRGGPATKRAAFMSASIKAENAAGMALNVARAPLSQLVIAAPCAAETGFRGSSVVSILWF